MGVFSSKSVEQISEFNSLSLITWNVWFESPFAEERYNNIFDTCSDLTPHFICFQEATHKFLGLLKKHSLLDGYNMSDNGSGSSLGRYGTILMARKEIQGEFNDIFFPQSRMGRSLRTFSFQIPSGGENEEEEERIVIGTVHLESLSNASERQNQLQISHNTISPISTTSVLCGDFNFDDKRAWVGGPPVENEEMIERMVGWNDLWTELRDEEENGYTFEGGVNSFVRKKDEVMRYDRILLRSEDGKWRGEWISKLGVEPFMESEDGLKVFPSDHYGLHTILTRTTPSQSNEDGKDNEEEDETKN